jgi:hypothetical protein
MITHRCGPGAISLAPAEGDEAKGRISRTMLNHTNFTAKAFWALIW